MDGARDVPLDALDEFLQALRPSLSFVAKGPAEASRTVVPAAQLAAKARELALASPDDGTRSFLQDLASILDTFEEVAASERPQTARRCLDEIDRYRTASAVAAAPRTLPVYRRTEGDIGEMHQALAQSVQFVKGVGPRRADELRRLGIGSVEELIFHLPFRYEDRRQVVPIARAVIGQSASFVGELVHFEEKIVGRARRRILQGVLRDETGLLGLVWFNQVSYFRSRYRPGQEVLAYGRIEIDQGGAKQIVHPEVEPTGAAAGPAIVPVYNKPGNMSVKAMRKIVHQAVADFAKQVPSILPGAIVETAGVVDLETALRGVHKPSSEEEPETLAEFRSTAHRSLIFDELFFLQLGLAMRRRATVRELGLSMEGEGPLTATFERALPFALTAAQQRVISEITDDMTQPHPMHRLVQGDVGSGKTVVALYAALVAVQSGRQVAFMAPTELLAEQHYRTICTFTDGLDVRVELLTGSLGAKEKKALNADLASGAIQIAVGTHALIQESVAMKALGLGVIDEQHRFGVLQRAALRSMGQGLGDTPDILLMTATPIPRTLAMTVYGDLDVSVLDELPPGRKPVVTRVVHEAERGRAYATVRREVEAGRQAYVVYPLVESSDKMDLRDATTMAQELTRSVFPGVPCRTRTRPNESRGEGRRHASLP